MTAHAQEVLEFRTVLAAIGGRAASPDGRAAVQALEPLRDPDAARLALATVDATAAFLGEKPGWAIPVPPEMEGALDRLELDGGVLSGVQLDRVGRLLRESTEFHRELSSRPELDPRLGLLRDRIEPRPALAEEIGRTVDEEGEVLDSASRELARIRRSLKGARNRLVKRLEAYVKTLPERFVVPDASVSIREGRYVIPVRREGKGEVGGIVHDESGSGATIFVEPPVAVAWMNEVRELERSEAREVQRILRALSARLHPLRHELRDARAVLIEFDSLVARARTALDWGAVAPALRDRAEGGFRIVGGRHPLLLLQGTEVVPFDLEMAPEERTLIVSGPNTGGKSVFLKSLGLLVLLARSGVVPPVAKGTELPDVDEVFADIGDAQSIAESLSTFSAHLATLRRVVERASERSLVLIDEMGTGTDPTEGAALARAILETLTERGALTVATSHLGALKSLDVEGSGIVNASLEFDAQRMAPTYRLVKGRPGRSYGLAIARRLGFPPEVLDRAQTHVDEGSASVEDLLERLEKREREARDLVTRLDMQNARVERLETRLKEQRRDLDTRERTAEKRAKEDARKLLLDARSEVEAAIREVRGAADEKALEAAARRARRQVEEAAAAQKNSSTDPASESVDAPELEVGMRVRVGRSGGKGRVVEIEGDRVSVDVGGIRMKLPAADLRPIEGGEAAAGVRGRGPRAKKKRSKAAGSGSGGRASSGGGAARSSERGWSGPMPTGRYEIDLRGLRVDEVDFELARALDGAILSDLHEVRVIHGKGTGAVKARVREFLKRDARVDDWRDGQAAEGGTGVTLVTFR